MDRESMRGDFEAKKWEVMAALRDERVKSKQADIIEFALRSAYAAGAEQMRKRAAKMCTGEISPNLIRCLPLRADGGKDA